VQLYLLTTSKNSRTRRNVGERKTHCRELGQCVFSPAKAVTFLSSVS